MLPFRHLILLTALSAPLCLPVAHGANYGRRILALAERDARLVAAVDDGSISDQIFHVANVFDRAVAVEFPGRRVAMYPYHNSKSICLRGKAYNVLETAVCLVRLLQNPEQADSGAGVPPAGQGFFGILAGETPAPQGFCNSLGMIEPRKSRSTTKNTKVTK